MLHALAVLMMLNERKFPQWRGDNMRLEYDTLIKLPIIGRINI